MTENTKTLIFGMAALAATALAIGTRTRTAEVASLESSDKPLFEQFTDPLLAKSLKIVRFDEGLANLSEIEVKQVNGIWTLPSHDAYPADAKDRIRDAATPFVDLRPIRIVSDSDGDHALYGVQEPSQDKSAVGDQGVGTLVNIKDEAGTNLVNVIIGKPVKGQEGQRYIRRVNQSRVYVAAIDPTKLPAKFEDWIEKDLLNVNAWDISKLQLKDYTFQVAQTLQGPVTDFEQRLEITLTDDNGTWKLDQLLEARDGQMQPTQLLEGEELNTDRINALKDALDSLEIVDVQRKPQGMGEDLRADKGFFSDQAGVDSLVERGFYPVQISGDAIELLSTDGEVLATTKDGVEYVLRFGRVAGVDTESEEGKLKRFLLVSARVDQSQFPEPVLEPLPEAPAAAAPEAGSQSSATQTLTRFAALQNSDAAVEPTPDTAVPASDTAAPELPAALNADAAAVPAESAAPAPGSEAPAAAPAAASEAGTAAPAAGPPSDLQAERERITKENQRKIDERNEKIKKAQEKVRELNYRFADWYYVISEDVYKKIHLGRADVIRETKAAIETGSGLDAFRNLEGQGLEKKTETPAPNEGDTFNP